MVEPWESMFFAELIKLEAVLDDVLRDFLSSVELDFVDGGEEEVAVAFTFAFAVVLLLLVVGMLEVEVENAWVAPSTRLVALPEEVGEKDIWPSETAGLSVLLLPNILATMPLEPEKEKRLLARLLEG